MTDLGTLGGPGSCGYAINASGQITGYADTGTASHAFLDGNGTMTDLGTVGAEPTSAGVSINANGDVVGYAWPYAPFAPLQPPGLYGAAGDVVPPIYGGPVAHAFLYSQGVITDLFPSPPGPVGSYFAFGINDTGQIAGDIAAGLCTIVKVKNACACGRALTSAGACTVTLTNNTAAIIPVTGVAIAGAFAQTNTCTGSLAPAASCVITVTFKPTAPDIELGALTVGAAGSQYATLLQGAAIITAKISSSAAAIAVNQPFTLTWSATAGAKCTAGGDTQFNSPVSVSGSKTITEPAAETVTFTLNCTEGSQSAQAQVTVTVTAASPGRSGGGGSMDLAWIAALLTLFGFRRELVSRR